MMRIGMIFMGYVRFFQHEKKGPQAPTLVEHHTKPQRRMMLDRICDQLMSTTDVVSWVFHCDFINFIPVNTWQMCSLIISDHSPNSLVYIVI